MFHLFGISKGRSQPIFELRSEWKEHTENSIFFYSCSREYVACYCRIDAQKARTQCNMWEIVNFVNDFPKFIVFFRATIHATVRCSFINFILRTLNISDRQTRFFSIVNVKSKQCIANCVTQCETRSVRLCLFCCQCLLFFHPRVPRIF